MTRAHNLRVAMPLGDPMASGGPCTPSPFEIKSLSFGKPRAIPTSVSANSVTSNSSCATDQTGSVSGSSAASDDPQTPASAMAGLALSPSDMPEVTPLSSPMISPPSITGKRRRQEWNDDEIHVLESVLAVPPHESLHFPPGSMPPPDVLDGMTSAIMDALSGDTDDDDAACADDESAPSSPVVSIGSFSIDQSCVDNWPHTWEETRQRLASIALADTRLGAEIADRKLTRQERLARPGLKRVNSMDYLDDDEETQVMPSERIGRVLRLSTTLQKSARESVPLARTLSLGLATTRPSRSASGSTGSSSTLTPPVEAPPPLMRRCSSGRSISSSGSRRPSLLARGRSFTAEDLEAEDGSADETEHADSSRSSDSLWGLEKGAMFGDQLQVDSPVAMPPHTPTEPVFSSPVVVSPAKNRPAVSVSSPSPPKPAPHKRSPPKNSSTKQSPPHKRRPQLLLGRSRSYGPSPREAHTQRDEFLAPAVPRALGIDPQQPNEADNSRGLEGAFEMAAPGTTKAPTGWESEDSDKEGATMKRPAGGRRKRLGTLAMTAMNAAAAATCSDSSSNSSSRGSRAGSTASSSGSGACTPPLVISTIVDEAALARGAMLHSPFEEKPQPEFA